MPEIYMVSCYSSTKPFQIMSGEKVKVTGCLYESKKAILADEIVKLASSVFCQCGDIPTISKDETDWEDQKGFSVRRDVEMTGVVGKVKLSDIAIKFELIV